MQLARRVRVHRHEIEVRLIGDVRCLVEAGRAPALLPFGLDGFRRVAFGLLLHFARHVDLLSQTKRSLVQEDGKTFRGTTSVKSPGPAAWWSWRDSNPRPPHCQCDALPLRHSPDRSSLEHASNGRDPGEG